VGDVTEPDAFAERLQQKFLEVVPTAVDAMLRILRDTDDEKLRKRALRELRRATKQPAWDTLSDDQKAEVKAALGDA
jgi:hypothetical protein